MATPQSTTKLCYILLFSCTLLQVICGSILRVMSSQTVSVLDQKTEDYLSTGIIRDNVTDYKIVCYFTNWSQYRPGPAKFYPENIDAFLCTHIIYAFAKIDSGILAPTEWNDETTSWMKGMYERVTDLKKINPKLKILLSVGGWNMGSQPFCNMVANSGSRYKFITNAVTFLRNHTFDGLDVDWEYPAQRGSPPQDKQRFSLFLQETMQAFVQDATTTKLPRLLLTVAVAAGKTKIDDGYDVRTLTSNVDFLNLLSYDFHGSWDTTTGECSPLYASKKDVGPLAYLNQDWAVRYWIQKGVPPDMLLLGMAAYGRSFTLKSPADHGIGANVTGPGQSGTFTRTAGFLAYYETCSNLQRGWKRVWDAGHQVPYAYHSNQWVGYDDVQSMALKAHYIKDRSLGGAMFWSFAMDDFGGYFCGQGNYTLMHTVKRILQRGG